jgi:hypothetical protein
MITYNTFIQRFKDFADNHYFIRSFSHGAPEDVDLEKFNEYPLMHVIYTGANYEDTTKTLSFEVYIFDLPSHYENKQDRQKEVVSDAEQCAEDVIADIVNGGNIFVHEEDYTVQTARVTPLQEESSNVLAGVLLEVDIQIPYDRDACNAPIDGVSPEGGEIVYARRGVLRVRTLDSGTDVLSVRTIVVPNGRLTDDGGGQVTLDFTSITELAELDDVNLDEPLDREALVYDEATTSWINGGPAKVDIPVFNNTFSAITKGQVIQFGNSAQGDRMGITLFSATSINDPKAVVGIASENIPVNEPGHVRAFGNIYGINTNAYPVGTILFASVTDGQLTSTAPTAPNHRIAIAVVTRQHQNTGRIFVRNYTPAYRLADLSNVASTAPTSGQALSWDGTKWAPANVGYTPGTPPPGGFLGNVFYQDNAGNFTFEDEFRYTESTNTLAVENITGTTVTGSGVVKGSNTFGQRYATQAATNRAAADTASLTVERYFTVTAEGNGESFNIQSDTPSAGNKIVRKIWYKDEAFEDTDVDTWTLLHTFADDATYASTATKWQEYLDGQANGTPPFTLAISWEDIPAFTGLLDTYGSAEAAYSLRLLRSAYTGDAIRVRRASDNTEQDIGFDVNGDFDTSALTTFCTGTDGFVKTWYDQSGNAYDATQSTTANQPKIYDSSTGVITQNSLPSLDFDGTAHHLNADSLASSYTGTNLASTALYVCDADASSGARMIAHAGNTAGTAALRAEICVESGQWTTWMRSSGNITKYTNYGLANNNYNLHAGYNSGTQLTYYRNGSSIGTAATDYGASTFNTFQIGVRLAGASTLQYYWDGKIQELIFYISDKSSDRAGIETNINDYYSIY